MYTSVRKILENNELGKWIKVTDEELQCIVESIPGENMLRNAHMSNFNRADTVGENLRYFVRDGYIVVTLGTSMEAEKHPLDLQKETNTQKAVGVGEKNVAVKKEPGIFASA